MAPCGIAAPRIAPAPGVSGAAGPASHLRPIDASRRTYANSARTAGPLREEALAVNPPGSAPSPAASRPLPSPRRALDVRGGWIALAVAGAALALSAAGLAGTPAAPPSVAAERAVRRASALQDMSGTTCITPSADATVDSQQPTATLGSAFSLQVARVRAVPVQQRWAYARFATATLPIGVELVSATLSLKVQSTSGLSPYSQAIYAASGAWDEASITWSNRPRTVGPYGNTAFDGQATTVVADVTQLVDAWLTGALPNDGLALEPSADFDAVSFYAREYNDPPRPPQLCVAWRMPTATPTATASATPTATDTSPPRPSATATPTPTDTPPPTATPSPTNTPRFTATAAPPSSTPTSGPSATPSTVPSATVAPTITASPTRAGTPTPTATAGPPQLDLTVDDAGDAPDVRAGDGRCRTSAGRCTLRAALQEADRNGATDVRIVFDAAIETITVPAGAAPLGVQRTNVVIDGVSGRPAALGGAALRPAADRQAAGFVRLVGAADPTGGATPGLTIDGARGVVIDGLAFEGFAVGVAILNRAMGVEIGAATAGAHGNRFTRNVVGLAVDGSATDVTVRANDFEANRADGIRLARTSGGRIRLVANRITGNGNAAIAVAPDGAQTEPPVISSVDVRAGAVNGTACPGCLVELFTDRGAQARRVTGRTATAGGDGRWSVIGLVLGPDDVNITATATRGDDTSRLSSPFAVEKAKAWTLSERPGASPATLRGRRLVRSYILRDDANHLVNGAVLRFLPEDLGLQFPVRTGFVDVSLPVEIAATLFSRKLHTSLEAVESSGVRHSVRWTPNLAVAVAQAGAAPGDVLLDLVGLGPLGLGARFRIGTFAARTGLGHAVGDAVESAAANDDAYAAAYMGAPADLREGPYAWTQNIAAGGGIYELQTGGEAVSGPLEIVAPVAAYNAGGPASGCPGSGAGAVVCGWLQMGRCWAPVPGSSAQAPAAGSSTFVASAPVSLPADGGAARLAQFTEPITIFTVGYDVDPPVYTSTLASDISLIGRLPSTLGVATDARSGVNADGGVVATLANEPIPLRYDPDQRRIIVTNRTIPANVPDGPATIQIRISDGFCNATSASFDVQVVRGSTILLPHTCKKCSMKP